MPQYRVRFTVPAEVFVEIEADDEDAAADEAWTAAQDHLPSLAVSDARGVQVFVDLDGIGADDVMEQAPSARLSELVADLLAGDAEREIAREERSRQD